MPTLQQLADRGIQVANGQLYSNVSGNTYTPVGGSAAGATAGQALQQGISTMTLAEAQRQADQAFSGIVAPMSLEEIRAREEAAKAVTAETAASIYNPQISREKQTGASQVSTAEGVVGQRQGFNISTAEQAFVADVQNKVQDRIKEVENIKAAYISQGNLAAADRADAQIQLLNEFNTQMTIAKANYALQIMAGNREQAQLELAQAQAKADQAAQNRQLDVAEIEMLSKIPEGKTFTYNGKTYTGMASTAAEPLTNSELISLMKEVPYGETQTFIFDGQEYTVTGINQNNPNVKTIESTDNAGNVTITTVDTSTGKVTNQVSAGKIGKTGGSGTSVTLQMNANQQAGLDAALSRLQSTIGGDGKYNTDAVIKELQDYGVANPGKVSQFLDIVKPKINPADLPRVTGTVKPEEDENPF